MVLFREKAIDLYSPKIANILMRVKLFPEAICFSKAPYFQLWMNKKKVNKISVYLIRMPYLFRTSAN